jgi:urate oxidase
MERFAIVEKEYGKAGVKMLYVSQKGAKYTIKELEVETSLTLDSEKDYKNGDNNDIIATDSQKNTVYILAKQFGVECLEEFGLRLANHFINKYPWVVRARIDISQHPWTRIIDDKGSQHNHAFVSTPTSTRTAQVILERGSVPQVSAGIRGLTVIKTTQSAFVDFVRDEYRSLPDMKDRIFSTIVTADWGYNITRGFDFCATYSNVKNTILDVFAGPADKGIFSPSVQQTQFLTQKKILLSNPQIEHVKISMPNRHYFPVDFTKFPLPGITGEGAGQVLLPVDKPSGMITSKLARSQIISKL